MRSLPSKFNPKVSPIEETTKVDTLNKDQICGSLIAYEMRIPKGKETSREVTFKADKPIEEKVWSCSSFDEEEEKFIRRLKKYTGKYKWKIPFKCFNCGRVGHYASKLPFKKEENQFKGKEKKKSNKMQKERQFKKKIVYAQEDSSGSESSNESSSEGGTSKFILMALEELEKDFQEYDE